MTWQIVEARAHHVGQIVHRLRAGHMSALGSLGFSTRDVHKEVSYLFGDSSFRRAWILDGRLVGLGGVTGTTLSPHGFVWLALSEDVIKFPLAIIKEARRQLGEIMITKTELATTVLGNDETALRFSAFLGFHAAHDDLRKTRHETVQELRTNLSVRLPVGAGFAVAMGYHEEGRRQCA